MAITPSILAQTQPGAASLTDSYTVPGATTTTISTITACNTNAASTTFQVTVAPAGAVDANVHALYEDITIAGNDTFAATLGITLGATDVIRVESASGNVVFHIYGHEET